MRLCCTYLIFELENYTIWCGQEVSGFKFEKIPRRRADWIWSYDRDYLTTAKRKVRVIFLPCLFVCSTVANGLLNIHEVNKHIIIARVQWYYIKKQICLQWADSIGVIPRSHQNLCRIILALCFTEWGRNN